MRVAVCVFLSIAVLSTVAARADDEPHGDAQYGRSATFEITPFAGYRLGGDVDLQGSTAGVDLDDHGSFAIALGLRADSESQYELFYSRQETKLAPNAALGPLGVDVEYLHAGGTLVLDNEHAYQPYIVGGLGFTRFSPGSNASGARDDSRFSVSLGAGMRFPVTQHFGLRLEARGYLTFIDTDSAFFCASSAAGGVCAIRTSGSTFVQYDLLLGAAFNF